MSTRFESVLPVSCVDGRDCEPPLSLRFDGMQDASPPPIPTFQGLSSTPILVGHSFQLLCGVYHLLSCAIDLGSDGLRYHPRTHLLDCLCSQPHVYKIQHLHNSLDDSPMALARRIRERAHL